MLDLVGAEKLFCNIESDIIDNHAFFDSGIIEDIPKYIFTDSKYSSLREYAIFRMGFSVVTRKNCRVLAEIIGDKRVLEVMCGLGAYSATLRSLGVDIIPTDDMSWMCDETEKYHSWKEKSWLNDIEKIDAIDAVMKYGKNVDFILMSWPPQNDSLATQVLDCMRRVNSNCRLIYVGESCGGCTADDSFFEKMVDVTDMYGCANELRSTYRAWESEGYFDKQYILR